jgi:PGF-pre-PGF domain-containing protein
MQKQARDIYIAATIEVLKDTSALVSTPPSGEVYQNMNIWVGNAGYATEDKISNPSIEFKVARTWIAENNINQYKIQLCRYSSGVWNPLPTTKKYEDVKYIYFTSKTSGFMALNMPEKDTPTTYFSTPSTSTDDMTNSDEMKGEIDVPHEEAKSSRGWIFLLSSIGIIAIIIFMYRRRDSSWDMP